MLEQAERVFHVDAHRGGQPTHVAQHTQDAQQREIAKQLERHRALGLRAQVDQRAGHRLERGLQRLGAARSCTAFLDAQALQKASGWGLASATTHAGIAALFARCLT